ncbi:uncharacterized protein LOC113795203 [Dermatophagoides pteronyssinus]|uniref:uncharacterized protein LOC113795203 n=1 Tax=Dermatophagoides pteronyssinus TaxID=6956 RepID=UPI003F6615BD
MLLFIIQKRRYRKLSKFRMNQFQQTNIFFNDFAIFTIIIISLSSMLIEISAHQYDHNVDNDQSLNRSVSIKENHIDTVYKMPILLDLHLKFPSSFAILVNYGLHGHKKKLYSSWIHNDRCKSNEIWDPFNNQCRRLYCREKNNKYQNDQCHYNKYDQKPVIEFLDSLSKFINITVDFITNIEIDENIIIDLGNNIIKDFRDKFSNRWHMNNDHLVNISVEYVDQQILSINFLILDTRKNNHFFNELSQRIIFDQSEQYELNGIMMTAINIHSIVSELKNFCLNLSDMPIWYWNSEFDFITKNDETFLFVNGTGRIYQTGEYTGSILYVGDVRNNNNLNQNENKHDDSVPLFAKFSTNAVVCEQTLIDYDCPRILLKRNEYEFINGKDLYSNNIHYEHYELSDNYSIYVCIKNITKSYDEYVRKLDTMAESILSTSLMFISIIMLTLLLITFLRFKRIRQSINGFNSINLAICLEMMQILFLSNQFMNNCRIAAVLFHFFILSTISWSSVIAYEMHRVFITKKLVSRTLSNRSQNKIRLQYGLVGYVSTFIIIIIANVGDVFNIELLKANYGRLEHTEVCWMRRSRSTIYYFIIPATLAIIYNLLLYIRIVCNIRHDLTSISSLRRITRISTSSDTSSSSSSSSSLSSSNPSNTMTISVISSDFYNYEKQKQQQPKSSSSSLLPKSSTNSKFLTNQSSIYVKLGVPLGFTWIIALILTIIPQGQNLILNRIISYIFIIANTSQGMILFLSHGVYKNLFKQKN